MVGRVGSDVEWGIGGGGGEEGKRVRVMGWERKDGG